METSNKDMELVKLSELTKVGSMAKEIVDHVDSVESRTKSVRSEVQMVDVWDRLCF